MVDVAELRAMLAKATGSCPAGAEVGSVAHLNGVTRARIEIVKALPALLNAWEERERLREALSTACGNLMNLTIDLSTFKPKREIEESAREAHRRARTALQGGGDG